MLKKMKDELLVARKSGNKIEASILTLAISSAEMVGKNTRNGEPTEPEVIQAIKKILNGIEETIGYLKPGSSDYEKLCVEQDVLKKFLPKEMTIDELTAYIESLKGVVINRGEALKRLKSEYAGRYDGRLANIIAMKIFQ